MLQLRAAQIQITIFEARILASQIFRTGDFKLKRRSFCLIQNQKLADFYFNIARRKFSVVPSFITQSDFAFNGDNEFAAQIRVEVAKWGKVIKDAGIKVE